MRFFHGKLLLGAWLMGFRLASTSTSPLPIRSSFPLRTSAIEPSTLGTSVEFKALRRRKRSFVFDSLSTINRVRALSFIVSFLGSSTNCFVVVGHIKSNPTIDVFAKLSRTYCLRWIIPGTS
jgi:hypothetical protein